MPQPFQIILSNAFAPTWILKNITKKKSFLHFFPILTAKKRSLKKKLSCK